MAWRSNPFTEEEARHVERGIANLSTDPAKQNQAFEKLRDALLLAQCDLKLDKMDDLRKPGRMSDDIKKLKKIANTGKYDFSEPWINEAIEYGRLRAGIDITVGDERAISAAAKEAIQSGLFKDKPGRPENLAQDNYVSVVREVYAELTGRPITHTRTTDTGAEPGTITGQGGDFMRAALQPFGVTEDKIAEAIMGRKQRRRKTVKQ